MQTVARIVKIRDEREERDTHSICYQPRDTSVMKHKLTEKLKRANCVVFVAKLYNVTAKKNERDGTRNGLFRFLKAKTKIGIEFRSTNVQRCGENIVKPNQTK